MAKTSCRRGVALASTTALLAVTLSSTTSAAEHRDSAPHSSHVLRLATINPEPDPALTWFVDRVDELSGGAVSITVVSSCCGQRADNEQLLVNSVAAGDHDLGWVATRVFTGMGIDGFAALTAPLLLDSYAAQQAVLASDVSDDLLPGVGELGVTGLALVPGPLRRPIAAAAPLRAPADWAGLTIHVYPSPVAAAAVESLGATATQVGSHERDLGLADGNIDGVENGIGFQAGRESVIPYATVNVNLWPGIGALIVNPAVLADLPDADIALIEQAAGDAVDRTGELAAVDSAGLAARCRAGARYATASEADLAALSNAFAPVYAALEQDPLAAALIARIRDVKETITAEPAIQIPDGCTDDTPLPVIETAGALDGTYRGPTRSAEDLIKLGLNQDDATGTAGTFTFTFNNGEFTLVHDWAGGEVFTCTGSYTIAGDRLAVSTEPGDCGGGGPLFTAAFAVSPDQLVLSDVAATHPVDAILFGTAPWVRV